MQASVLMLMHERPFILEDAFQQSLLLHVQIPLHLHPLPCAIHLTITLRFSDT